MEHYKFTFSSNHSNEKVREYAVVGVSASGNLEVLVEKDKIEKNESKVFFDIKTSIDGFETTWEAVIKDIACEYPIGGLKFLINDGGAVPAVVSLRLRQVFEEIFIV
jgi:malonate decarboxylase acyl carrier protein